VTARQADDALARWWRLEYAIRALCGLTPEQRALVPILPDTDDLEVLAAAMRLEREQGAGSSTFTRDGFGLGRRLAP
jgi:hypothetical protein